MNNPYSYAPLNNNSQQLLLPQANPNDTFIRWKVLLLACLSTFGVYYTEGLISFAEYPLIKTFNVSLVTYNTALNKVLGFVCIVPLVAGIMVYRFGVNRAYRFFILLLTIGRSFTFASFRTQTWTLFVTGESFFSAANYGLWVAQIYMIIKWFKGKELSFAIGIVGLTNNAAYLLALYLYAYEYSIGLTNLLLMGVVFCIFAAIAVIILNKTDQTVKRIEENRNDLSFFRDLGLIKKPAIVLFLAIFCFSVADFSSRVMYMFDMISRFLTPTNFTLEMIDRFNLFIPPLMLPLLGLLADWKKKRIATMFAGIITFFIGNTAFFLFHQSDDLIFIYLAFLLFRLGACLFQVSSFACVGVTTPTRVIGLLLGLIYSLVTFANWLEEYIYFDQKLVMTTICYLVTGMLIIGIGLVIETWKLDKENGGKIEPRYIENDGISYGQIGIN